MAATAATGAMDAAAVTRAVVVSTLREEDGARPRAVPARLPAPECRPRPQVHAPPRAQARCSISSTR